MASEKKEIIITISADTQKAIKNSADARKAVEDVTKAYEQNASSVRDLTKLIKQYQSEAIKAGEKSAIGQAFLQRAGQLKDRLDDLRATVKVMGSDTAILQGFTQAAAGIASGFQIAQGAAALFGEENEDLQKTLVRIQASMSILNGLQQIQNALQKESTILIQLNKAAQLASNAAQAAGAGIMSAYGGAVKLFTGQMTVATAATNILNVATKALMGPIGWIIAAIGALGAAVLLLKDKFSSVDESMLKGLEVAKQRQQVARQELEAIEGMTAQLKLQGKSEREILMLKKQKTEEVLAAAEAELKLQTQIAKAQFENAKKNKEILQNIIKFIQAPLVGLLKGIDLIGEAFGKNFGLVEKFTGGIANIFFDPVETGKQGLKTIEESEKIVKELREKRAQFQLDIQQIDKDAANKLKEQNERELKEKQRLHDELLKEQKAFQDAWDAERERQRQEDLKREQEQTQQLIDEHQRRGASILNSQREVNEFLDGLSKNSLDKQLRDIDLKRIKLVESLNQQKQDRILDGEDEVKVTEEINAKIKEVNDASRELELEAERVAAIAKREIIIGGVEEFINNFKTIANDNAAAQKTMAVAQATINTYQAATKALAAYPPPLSFIAAGSAVAAGLINVQKIVSTDLPGFAGGGRILSGHGAPIRRSNGDTRLITAKPGEVVLNEVQQARLGGASTFKRIGVPGFATGGIVPDGGFTARSIASEVNNSTQLMQMFKMAAQSLPAPIVGVKEFTRVSDKVAKIQSTSEH